MDDNPLDDLEGILHDLRSGCEPGCETAHPCRFCRAVPVIEALKSHNEDIMRKWGETIWKMHQAEFSSRGTT